MENKSYQKICKKCISKSVIKFGIKRGKQRYKCKSCTHVFVSQSRKKKLNSKLLWNDYVFGKQTYKQLSEKYNISVKTVQKVLDKYGITRITSKTSRSCIIDGYNVFLRYLNYGIQKLLQ